MKNMYNHITDSNVAWPMWSAQHCHWFVQMNHQYPTPSVKPKSMTEDGELESLPSSSGWFSSSHNVFTFLTLKSSIPWNSSRIWLNIIIKFKSFGNIWHCPLFAHTGILLSWHSRYSRMIDSISIIILVVIHTWILRPNTVQSNTMNPISWCA